MNRDTIFLACVAGIAIANNYAIQPALTDVAATFNASLPTIGLVTTAALAGCMLGFALLLPLVDRMAPNRLVAGQLAVLAAALAAAAAAPNAPILIATFATVGTAASVAAQASVVARRAAAPPHRAAAVAVVAAGLSAGILVSRLAGGALTAWLGWRAMLLVCAGIAALCAAAAAVLLPGGQPTRTGSYFDTLRSLPALLRRHGLLRRSAAAGALWYFAFSMTWVALALRLAQPPYSLSPAHIGFYSLAGLLGFASLPAAGRFSDRHSPRIVIAASMATAAIGALLLATGLGIPAITGIGLALLDAGCFAAQAANQSRIITIDPGRGGSLSGVYLLIYFAAGTLGTAVAAPLLALGWTSAAVVAFVALAFAASVTPADRSARPTTVPEEQAAAHPGVARPVGQHVHLPQQSVADGLRGR